VALRRRRSTLQGARSLVCRLMPVPPATLLRVIPGSTWSRRTWLDWLKHVASRKVGGGVQAPQLGRKTIQHVYVTDEPSLDGYLSPGAIASRLGLPMAAHTDCNKHGLVIVRFTISDPTMAILPPPTLLAARQGYTSGHAREWLVPNTHIDASMDVMYIGISPFGNPFWYLIPLTD
jgi:hypothetical protein